MDASAIALKAGIVGAGGAGFPTHVKLASKANSFIVNAAECEPLIEVDKFLIRTRANDLVAGAVEMARAVSAGFVVIAIKKAYKKEIACLNAAISGYKPPHTDTANKKMPEISVFQMRSFYPAGDEQLIAMLYTGKTVPERGLPLEVGAVVDNVATVLNYYDARDGKPVTHRVLSVTGAVNNPCMLRVPIGTSVKECVDAAGGCELESSFILGGPMMGKFYDLPEIETLSIKKTDGNVLALPPGHKLRAMAKADINKVKNRARAACIRCRMCTDLCPRYLTGHGIAPHIVMRNFYRIENITDNKEFEKAFGSAVNCCECGVCENYACPMMLSPRCANVYAKLKLRERGINPARDMEPHKREYFDERLVPTARLTARLGLARFAKNLEDNLKELEPTTVTISLGQQIGAPCIPCVSPGVEVAAGDLIASPPEGKLGANLHASISGVVEKIEQDAIFIRRLV